MDSVTSIAAAAAAAKQAQVQMALAARLAKMNAGNQQSVVQLLQAADANMQQAAKAALPPGVGGSLDITA